MRRMPRIEQHPRVPRELRAVGRHGQLVEAVADALAKRIDQKLDALADQRLAAGQADPPHAPRDEDVGELDQLLEGQHVLARQERHRFRHAITAAEVAAVGDRHAHVGDPPAEAVDHRLENCGILNHARPSAGTGPSRPRLAWL